MKIVVAIGGASGSIYAKILLNTLRKLNNLEVNYCMTENAIKNWELENGSFDENQIPFRRFSNDDYNAPFASGSGKFDAMIICPCSAGLMGRIANGVSVDLITRAADVMLKERKKLILVLRETPLSLIHIENMKKITLAGGIICPAIPSFYSNPGSLEEVLRTVTNRALELCGIDTNSFTWGKS